MSGRTGRPSLWVPWTVLVTASLLLVGSVAFAASGMWQSTSVPAARVARPTVARPTAAQPSAARPTATVPTTARTNARGGMGNRGGTMMDTHTWLAGNDVQVTTIAAARARAAAAATGPPWAPSRPASRSR